MNSIIERLQCTQHRTRCMHCNLWFDPSRTIGHAFEKGVYIRAAICPHCLQETTIIKNTMDQNLNLS